MSNTLQEHLTTESRHASNIAYTILLLPVHTLFKRRDRGY